MDGKEFSLFYELKHMSEPLERREHVVLAGDAGAGGVEVERHQGGSLAQDAPVGYPELPDSDVIRVHMPL